MYRHSRTISYIVFGLIALGILVNIKSLWLPLLVFGIIFYLYKFPPKQFQRGSRNHTYRTPGRPSANPNKKKSMFRVIKGNKKDDDDDDNTPKYH